MRLESNNEISEPIGVGGLFGRAEMADHVIPRNDERLGEDAQLVEHLLQLAFAAVHILQKDELWREEDISISCIIFVLKRFFK